MNEIGKTVAERRATTMMSVMALEALGRDSRAYTAIELRHILAGMLDDRVPGVERIESSLMLLSHRSFEIIEKGEDGYELTTV